MAFPFRIRSFFRVSPALGLLTSAVIPLLGLPMPARSQGMLSGCQLIDGSLQCVPGVKADPEQQIKILRQEIGADQALEGAVGQDIEAIQQVLLQGPALVGAALTVSLLDEEPGEAPTQADGSLDPVFHWYRLSPGQQSWKLIPEARGATYLLTTEDLNQQVMVVFVVESGQTVRRTNSKPLGPIQQPQP